MDPIRYGDTSIRFELNYDDCGFLFKDGKEKQIVLDQHLIIGSN